MRMAIIAAALATAGFMGGTVFRDYPDTPILRARTPLLWSQASRIGRMRRPRTP